MKIRFLSLAVICALIALPRLQAENSPAPKTAETAAKKGKEHTELEEHMDLMGKAFGRVRRQIKDPSKNEDTLQALAEMRKHADAALTLEPAMKADLPAARQAKFVADYRAHMKSFIAELEKLESAVKAGNNDGAAEIIASLRKDQKAGHEQFKRPDEKKS